MLVACQGRSAVALPNAIETWNPCVLCTVARPPSVTSTNDLGFLGHHNMSVGNGHGACIGRPCDPFRRGSGMGVMEANVTRFEVWAIGRVESSLTDVALAPRQPDEGAPEAWLVFDPVVLEGLRGTRPGHQVIVITWLDRARRDVLSVHPRGDVTREQDGVFQDAVPTSSEPYWSASGGGHRRRRSPTAGAQSRSAGRHADPRRQTSPHRGHQPTLIR